MLNGGMKHLWIAGNLIADPDYNGVEAKPRVYQQIMRMNISSYFRKVH